MAVATAVPAQQQRMPRRSARRTTSSSTDVIGTEVTSAWRKSSLTTLLMARPDARFARFRDPQPGWAACTAANAR
jgi:hypothetical protein